MIREGDDTDDQTGYAENVDQITLQAGYHYVRVNDEGDWTDIDASPAQLRNIAETIEKRLAGEETAGDVLREHQGDTDAFTPASDYFDAARDEDPADLDEWGTPLTELLDDAWDDGGGEADQIVQCSHCGHTFEAVDTTGINSVAFLCSECGQTFDPAEEHEP